ncbi:hypothetical protein LUZ61_009266 [Rhynchospora tenuis]|uniref:Uncharacterized protein n=1 Tax=Rhynchospora tenuis TaxID=198213 RepID=A0AAD5ZWV9_9POAL|nr:hypothetical protein LUZ61_009266 [Rhynchospora tenuis]
MFEPSTVSIGPYHRGRAHLRAMEEKKWSFLHDFLVREGHTLQDCISRIKEVEEQARRCYSEPIEMSSDDFVEMMILDDRKENLDERRVWEIPCATVLEEAGVKFKMLEQSNDITKITFQSGTLVIPRIHITDDLKPVYMNLIAFEQCMSVQLPCYFSTYMMLLDCLVNTAHDVQILQKHGIIESMVSGEEEVALFFNQSGVYVMIPGNHYLKDLFKRVNKYYESRYHRYRARLCRDYFSNPWSIVALIATTLLLCLTIMQSFMSVYAYIHPPPSSPPS